MCTMLISTGHIALALALGITILGVVLPVAGITRHWNNLIVVGRQMAILQFVLVGIAYLTLTLAFVESDFSLTLVVNNSHTAKPLIYRLAGVWGNHEGSMLLWVLVLSLFACLVAVSGAGLAPVMRARVLATLSMISMSFIAFILFTSNPFARIINPPFDGNDLNPLLQDPGLAIHPPLLYVGYVGLAVPYSFAVAALISGRADAAWARWVRPWVLFSWLFLTMGIALGSWWAYYELGWGGWWFWDPVENVSFIPWLVATALLHSVKVVERRGCLASWTLLLAIAGFSLSLLGTFIVRSGIITSVHAFASDPTRGVFILAILLLFTGGALALYATRSHRLPASGSFATVSRESALLINNVLLTAAAAVVLTGTFWPILVEMANGNILSVGPPYFNLAFTPFALGLLLILPIGSTLAWKRGSILNSLRTHVIPAILAIMATITVMIIQDGSYVAGMLGLALSVWLISGALADFLVKIRLGKIPVGQSLSWAARLPAADWGKMIAHAGMGLTVLGIAGITAWEVEDIRVARPGDTYGLGSYEIAFSGLVRGRGPNYITEMGSIDLRTGNGRTYLLQPEIRYYPIANTRTVEAAIHTTLLRDVYVVLGESHPDGGRTLRIYIKPLVVWIWIGAAIMALGGLTSVVGSRIIAMGRRKGQEEPALAHPGS